MLDTPINGNDIPSHLLGGTHKHVRTYTCEHLFPNTPFWILALGKKQWRGLCDGIRIYFKKSLSI